MCIHKENSCKNLTDYDKSRCDSYEKDSVGRRDKLREDPRTNFFEKICFKGGMLSPHTKHSNLKLIEL